MLDTSSNPSILTISFNLLPINLLKLYCRSIFYRTARGVVSVLEFFIALANFFCINSTDHDRLASSSSTVSPFRTFVVDIN